MKVKYLLVIIAFALCLALVVLARQALSGEYKIHHVDFYDNGEDWARFEFDNLMLDQDGLDMFLESKSSFGVLQSPPIETIFAFDEILLSWNCIIGNVAGGAGGLKISISVSPDNNIWHEFDFQTWGNIDPVKLNLPNPPGRIKDIGWLDIDIIRLKKPMKFYKFKIICVSGNTNDFVLDRISVCYSNTLANIRQYNQHSSRTPDIESIQLAVPYKSQHWLPDSISGRTCSPTSVAMILNYHGRNFSHEEVSGIAYDELNDIYGNWPYNTQAAYMLGLQKTWVGRHNSFNELVDELKAGKPVAISIAFDEDQILTGAPYKSTDGHLIVVRGFDTEGKVLVNDPAGDNIEEGMVSYDIDELTAVWTGHQGVAYHLWPE